MSGLSELQCVLLGWLLERTREAEARNARVRSWVDHWGVEYYPTKAWPTWSKAQRVAASRAIGRLEQRGLVLRHNPQTRQLGAPGVRATHEDAAPHRATTVRLTAAGRAMAEQLAVTAAPMASGATAVATFGNRSDAVGPTREGLP